MLLHNEIRSHHSITLRILDSSRTVDAIGARVVVTAGAKRQIRQVMCGGSYLSSDSPEVHIGLGDAPQADLVTVTWPDGSTANYRDLKADHYYRIIHNDAVAAVVR
jgi:hypothetical protein